MVECFVNIYGVERPFKSKHSLIRVSGPKSYGKVTLVVDMTYDELRYYLIVYRHQEYVMHTCFFDPIKYCIIIPERNVVLSLDTPRVSFSMAINLRILSEDFLTYCRNSGIR